MILFNFSVKERTGGIKENIQLIIAFKNFCVCIHKKQANLNTILCNGQSTQKYLLVDTSDSLSYKRTYYN